MPRVCVIGSANVDYTMALPRLPRAGETVLNGQLLVNLGGKGANQAVAARRLGAEVRFLGAVGTDSAGEEIRARLAALLNLALLLPFVKVARRLTPSKDTVSQLEPTAA